MCCELIRVICLISAVALCAGQKDSNFTVTGFRQAQRTTMNAPEGRAVRLDDIIIRYYTNSTTPTKSYKIRESLKLLEEPTFNLKQPTLFYAHGYVELSTDESVRAVVGAHLTKGGYNIVLVDWSNLAFGNYLLVALDVKDTGREIAKAIELMFKNGLSLEGVHFVSHSLGCHVMSAAARSLNESGYLIPRLTGLDPAHPGFAQPLNISQALSSMDAAFVDIIHTDAGYYGYPASTGHADYWPNGGQGKQPGCPPTVPFSDNDFCSHWRSWSFYEESVLGGEFLARKSHNYDAFTRGQYNDTKMVYMGLRATPDLRGNFYLKTAAAPPYALGEKGAS